METCIIDKGRDIDITTPIYKYLSKDAFFYFLLCRSLMFSKLSTWPDSFEGARFDFFKQAKKDDKYSKKSKEYFFGSSWTLQTENSCFYDNPKEHLKSEEELQNHGSASMWEAYCQNGGVRIKTTIEKVVNILNQQASEFECYKGEAHYEPHGSWNKSLNSPDLISKLFIKRVSFRHESEYRFIIVSETERSDDRIFFNVDRLFDFVDEYLISPAVKSNIWLSRMLYLYAVNTSCKPEIVGTNHKNGKQYCRISNLYGNISETI